MDSTSAVSHGESKPRPRFCPLIFPIEKIHRHATDNLSPEEREKDESESTDKTPLAELDVKEDRINSGERV
jgi:hypothetical protein